MCAPTCAPWSRRRRRSRATWSSHAGAGSTASSKWLAGRAATSTIPQSGGASTSTPRAPPDPGGGGPTYEPARSRLGRGEEMFCGPVPRTEPKPRKDAVEAGRVLWVDIDRKSSARPPTLADVEQLLSGGRDDVHDGLAAAAALVRFRMPPHVVVFSGSGGAHGYWRVEEILRAEWIERANARLIHALEADWASYDRNRFLRMPGGINGKNGRSCHLIHADLTSRAYDVRDLVGGLPDPPVDDPRAPKRIRRRQIAPSPRRSAIDDPIDRWTPREYFAALCDITEYDRH